MLPSDDSSPPSPPASQRARRLSSSLAQGSAVAVGSQSVSPPLNALLVLSSFPFPFPSVFLTVSIRPSGWKARAERPPSFPLPFQDFRSQDGLYNLVKARYPDIVLSGKDLFSSSLFRSAETTSLFYSFIAELKLSIDAVEPSKTHQFIKKLDEKGKLLRSYTQNIDGLERRAGLMCSSSTAEETSNPVLLDPPSQPCSETGYPSSSQASSYPSSSQASTSSSTTTATSKTGPTMHKKWTKNVQLHGDIHQVRCIVCQTSYPFSPEFVVSFREGEAPDCPACEERGLCFCCCCFCFMRGRVYAHYSTFFLLSLFFNLDICSEGKTSAFGSNVSSRCAPTVDRPLRRGMFSPTPLSFHAPSNSLNGLNLGFHVSPFVRRTTRTETR